ncbi:MAG: acyltransferase [bacterium]
MIKLILKRVLWVTGLALTFPLILLTWLEAWILGRDYERILAWCKEILALVPTIVGEYLRLGYYSAVCRYVSPDASLLFGSMIAHRDTIIRRGVVVGVYTIIGKADIGEGVLFGARVSLLSGKYQHGRPEDRIDGQVPSVQYQVVTVGRNSWIGQGAIVMANVGENCTVSAGAVLYKDAPDGSTFMGNPARKANLDLGIRPSGKDGVDQ